MCTGLHGITRHMPAVASCKGCPLTAPIEQHSQFMQCKCRVLTACSAFVPYEFTGVLHIGTKSCPPQHAGCTCTSAPAHGTDHVLRLDSSLKPGELSSLALRHYGLGRHRAPAMHTIVLDLLSSLLGAPALCQRQQGLLHDLLSHMHYDSYHTH